MLTYFDSQTPKDNVFSLAFYNLENLYDIFDNPDIYDKEFTPGSEKRWTKKRYATKIMHLSQVISQIGTEHSFLPPILVGVAEVENKQVIMDLIKSKSMEAFHYDFVHYDSPDQRGIDVALLYQKEHFELLHSESFPLIIFEPGGERDYTRDILYVEGNFKGEKMHFLVNHWPSRREGKEISEVKRIAAAELVTDIIQKIRNKDAQAKIVVMGDFNDEARNESVKKVVLENNLYNPMEPLKSNYKGSSFSQKKWYLFDQIIFSSNFFEKEPEKHILKHADIFDVRFIKTWKGKLKNSPYRTYIGKWYQGGFSDHFPVMAYLERF